MKELDYIRATNKAKLVSSISILGTILGASPEYGINSTKLSKALRLLDETLEELKQLVNID